jgi:hypothetical protein
VIGLIPPLEPLFQQITTNNTYVIHTRTQSDGSTEFRFAIILAAPFALGEFVTREAWQISPKGRQALTNGIYTTTTYV